MSNFAKLNTNILNYCLILIFSVSELEISTFPSYYGL